MHRSAELQSPGLVTCFTTLHNPSNTAEVCSGDTEKNCITNNKWLGENIRNKQQWYLLNTPTMYRLSPVV